MNEFNPDGTPNLRLNSPVGNIYLGRRYTVEELAAHQRGEITLEWLQAQKCPEDHSLLIRFGGTCEKCKKTWELYR
jgi:hypothetical protein